VERLRHIHSQLLQREIPEILCTALEGLHALYPGTNRANFISQTICASFQSPQTRIQALRASTMYSLKRDESPWPIVEWRDNTGVIGMAIFDFTDGNETDAGGWLMHVGVGVGNGNEPGFFWQQSRVDWSVQDMQVLKTLFLVAQHLSGILTLPKDDAILLFQEHKRAGRAGKFQCAYCRRAKRGWDVLILINNL